METRAPSLNAWTRLTIACWLTHFGVAFQCGVRKFLLFTIHWTLFTTVYLATFFMSALDATWKNYSVFCELHNENKVWFSHHPITPLATYLKLYCMSVRKAFQSDTLPFEFEIALVVLVTVFLVNPISFRQLINFYFNKGCEFCILTQRFHWNIYRVLCYFVRINLVTHIH